MKVNVIARLEFELANFNVAVERVSHHAMGTTHPHTIREIVNSTRESKEGLITKINGL